MHVLQTRQTDLLLSTASLYCLALYAPDNKVLAIAASSPGAPEHKRIPDQEKTTATHHNYAFYFLCRCVVKHSCKVCHVSLRLVDWLDSWVLPRAHNIIWKKIKKFVQGDAIKVFQTLI